MDAKEAIEAATKWKQSILIKSGQSTISPRKPILQSTVPEEKPHTIELRYRGKLIDSFEATGNRIKLPAHVIEYLFPSNDFELCLVL
jgi:hypothetical protein